MTKPILFNTEMVRAILDGKKTVTRRVIKPHYKEGDAGFRINRQTATGEITGIEIYDEDECGTDRYVKPPYMPEDILYVRETWFYGDCSNCDGDIAEGVCSKRENGEEPIGCYSYKADQNVIWDDCKTHWKPSIHMPKEAARIWLKVTNVRVERLKDIFNDPPGKDNQIVREGFSYGCDFIAGWDETISKKDLKMYGYDANPWVWVIEFKKTENTDK